MQRELYMVNDQLLNSLFFIFSTSELFLDKPLAKLVGRAESMRTPAVSIQQECKEKRVIVLDGSCIEMGDMWSSISSNKYVDVRHWEQNIIELFLSVA